MKYCRFEGKHGPQFAEVEERGGELWAVRPLVSPWASAQIESTKEIRSSFDPAPLSKLALLPPVSPTKILCVGRNYRDHAKELGNEVPAEPLLFFKPPSSLLAPGGTIRMPSQSERVDFEGELAVVIARRARRLHRDQDLSPYIHGFTLANDVTARDLQKKDGQWTRAKGFDTFCPVGPIVDTELDAALSQETGLTIETHVNGELRQHGSTADFLFKLPVLLEYITAAMTLEAGDLLLTGTPAGVGPLKSGDRVEVSLPGLGRLSNPVAAAEA
jgi:2-keto-4-pentenoate hydratase/2-oxohepta-3-ene-1,7-dioic acid hydratase in catechol pathway